MYAESDKLHNQTESRMYHALWPISATVLHWTSILSKTFTSVTQISRVPTHAETIWFLSHKLYDAKQCEFYAHIYFPGILYPTRLLHVVPYLFNDRARHRFDAPILLRDIMASSTSILEYLVKVGSMHGHIEIFNTNVLKYTSSFFLI